MSQLIRRTVTTLVLSASAVGLIGAEAAHAAEMYKVNTSGIALTVRSGPGTNYSSVGSVPTVALSKSTARRPVPDVTGTYGRSNIWDQIAPGKFVSDSYVLTGHDNQFRPNCATGDTGAIKDDYPYRGQSTGADPWNFIKGNCTSFAAWRVNNRLGVPFNNYYKGPRWSHAKYWDDRARDVGIRVDHTPAVGAVAQWNSGTYGHVAWVARINTNGTVLLEEYNKGGTHKYSTRTVQAGAVENYIHF